MIHSTISYSKYSEKPSPRGFKAGGCRADIGARLPNEDHIVTSHHEEVLLI